MEFKQFRNAVREHFQKMAQEEHLFVADVDKGALWDIYLSSFPEGTNPLYRVNTVHDCSVCRHFIKGLGPVISIKGGQVTTLWDLDLGKDGGEYQVVADAMSKFIKDNLNINDVFLTKFTSYGADHTFGSGDSTEVYDHFYAKVPDKFVFRPRYGSTLDGARGQYRDTKHVFKRSLEEISLDSVEAVLDLISQNSLYRGEEWAKPLKEFRKYKKEYDALSDSKQKELYVWEKSVSVGNVVGRIRNHSMGTLLTDLSEGTDLDVAVRKYEALVAPVNYKRPKPVYTQKMLDDAKKTLTELGYMDSLRRRFACLDDITVNNIMFVDRDVAGRVQGADDIFAEMSKGVKTSAKKFSHVEEVPVERFISEVLPTAQGLEVYYDGKLANNRVSLIAPVVAGSKSMFKWNNNFSWAYVGNVTDSLMKERVKSAGGRVDGDLRFSIQWNDGVTHYSGNDLDAHCRGPKNDHIYYGSKWGTTGSTHGELDVDIINPKNGVPAVENITFADRKRMIPGKYRFSVHCYSHRGGNDGFRAEIEFDGNIYTFDSRDNMRQDEDRPVANVTLDKDGNFTIEPILPTAEVTKELWGLNTNQFVPVSVVCYSPNYWDEQTGNGNKHIFFMLKGCVNDEEPNAFYNEFLSSELLQHKRVFEALGSKLHVEDNPDQLSGLGFSTTKRAELVVKVRGTSERVLRVKF